MNRPLALTVLAIVVAVLGLLNLVSFSLGFQAEDVLTTYGWDKRTFYIFQCATLLGGLVLLLCALRWWTGRSAALGLLGLWLVVRVGAWAIVDGERFASVAPNLLVFLVAAALLHLPSVRAYFAEHAHS